MPEQIRNLNNISTFKQNSISHSKDLLLYYKTRFSFRSFHSSLTASKPLQHLHRVLVHDFLSGLSCKYISDLFSDVNMHEKNASKCILCCAGIAMIWQSWGCKWFQSSETKRSISWKVRDGKTFKHNCDNLFCLWFVNSINFVNWRNLLRNFKSLVDFFLCTCVRSPVPRTGNAFLHVGNHSS